MTYDAQRATDAAAAWWHGLQPDPDTGRPGDRATLAKLRRCATVAEAMAEPATITLFRRIGATHANDLPPIATLAVILAHLREDLAEGRVARRLGPDYPEAPETARMSALRLRRLLEAAPGDEQLTAFRRMVALAGGSLPLRDLVRSLLDWNDERRRRWIYDYWNAGQPVTAPTAEEPAA
jgi:CRISPR system Cascade subunit CasB